MEQPISAVAVRKIISGLKNGKSPGCDGLPREFYKHFVEEIIDLLVVVYEEAIARRMMPSSMRTALIRLIYKLKGAKDLLKYYRPISLLTVDLNILAKFVSNQLATVLPFLIHPQQTGFKEHKRKYPSYQAYHSTCYRARSARHTGVLRFRKSV